MKSTTCLLQVQMFSFPERRFNEQGDHRTINTATYVVLTFSVDPAE